MRQIFGKSLKSASEHISSQASEKSAREEIGIKNPSRVISDKKEKPAETSGIKVDKAYSDYLFNIILDEFERIDPDNLISVAGRNEYSPQAENIFKSVLSLPQQEAKEKIISEISAIKNERKNK